MGVLGAGACLVLAVLVAVAAQAGPVALAAAVAVAVLLVAAGWAPLLRLPDPRGTALVVAASGLAGAAAAVLVQGAERPLAVFAALVAASVLLAFLHELVRGGGRAELVESVTGTLSGQVVAVLGAGWPLVPTTALGLPGVVVAAAALAAAKLAGALPGPERFPGWAALLLGTAAGAGAAQLVVPSRLVAATAVAAGVAAVAAGLDRLLTTQPAASSVAGALAAAAAPVTAVGTVAYAVARLAGA